MAGDIFGSYKVRGANECNGERPTTTKHPAIKTGHPPHQEIT